MVERKIIICKCGTSFTPIIGYTGIVQSRSCPDCMYSSEMAKRRKKVSEVTEVDVKEAKKGLKSKIATKKKPKTTERKLILNLDREFSVFIRQRDSNNGAFKCISCQNIKPYAQADCGHYINRQHLSVRFDEVNCNAQCRKCNRFQEGNMQGYRVGLIEKYGSKAVDLLELKKSITRKYSVFELGILIDYYKQKNKDYLLSGELF